MKIGPFYYSGTKKLFFLQLCTENGQKKIDFLIGSDGNPWVWVMGEHTKDSTIDQILEKEAHEHANKLAEEETESLRYNTLS